MLTWIWLMMAGFALLLAALPWLPRSGHIRHELSTQARRHVQGASIVLALVTAALALKISLAWHVLNLAALAIALLCAGRLALLAFGRKPLLLWLPIGTLGVVAPILSGLGLALYAAFDDAPIEVALSDGRVCQWSMYGFVTSDSGSELGLSRRFGFVDMQLAHVVRSDTDPYDNEPAEPSLHEAVLQCDEKIRALQQRQGRI